MQNLGVSCSQEGQTVYLCGEVSELADENFLSSETREIIISDTGPTVLVGERINATGKERILMAFTDNMCWTWRC